MNSTQTAAPRADIMAKLVALRVEAQVRSVNSKALDKKVMML